MLLYISVMIISFAFLNLSKRFNDKFKKYAFITLAFIPLFLVSALRYNVGSDFASYQNWFNINNGVYLKYPDFAFRNLIFIIKMFTNNSQWLFVISSFLILFFVFKAARKNNDEYDMIIFLFVALGFYFSSFNGVRQWIASSIFLCSYRFILDKKLFKYLLCIIGASLFHVSALVLLPFYFVFNIKIKDEFKYIILISAIIFFNFVDMYELIATILKLYFKTLYFRYVIGGTHDIMQNSGTYFPVLLSVGMLSYYIIFKGRFRKIYTECEYNQKKNCCFVISIMAILNTVNYLFSRISAIYFLPLIIFLLPDVYKIFNGKFKIFTKALIVIVGILYLTINTLIKNSHDVLPYNSIFQIESVKTIDMNSGSDLWKK